MPIIDATVTRARRRSDWGRVEALVTITYHAHPNATAESLRMVTSAPPGPALRQRLTEDAIRLAALSAPATLSLAA